MKKVILIANLIAIIGCAEAQTDRGSWLLGASSSFGYSSTSYDAVQIENASNFNLEVSAGFFLIENLAAGLNIGYDKTKQGFDGNTTSLFGPFVRYYVKGVFFLGTSYAAASREEIFASAGETKKFGFLAFEAGCPIWIVDNVAIEPSLNYGIASGDDIVNSKTFGLNVGFSVYF
ncbi:hypothetical protein [Ekhidna sp.]|uniref:hypothetical protein n=1 Tax=Ekhidna sp. TaxID=2608089 RepID=UPI003B50AA44